MRVLYMRVNVRAKARLACCQGRRGGKSQIGERQKRSGMCEKVRREGEGERKGVKHTSECVHVGVYLYAHEVGSKAPLVGGRGIE